MADINKSSQDNVGGFNRVRFIDINNIIKINDAIDHTLDIDDIVIFSNEYFPNDWSTFYGSTETIQLDIETVETDAGKHYEITLRLRYPKDQALITNIFLDMANHAYLILVTNNQGETKLLGNKTSPMRMNFRILSPADIPGYNGYQVEFSGKFTYPPYSVNEEE